MSSISKYFFIYLILFLPIQSFSGKYSASFLKIGVGARFLGIGNVGTALSGEVSSFYWNPAGLATIANIRAELMYATQFGGFGSSLGTFQHAGFVLPLKGNANIALNWVRFAVNDIPVFPELEGRNIIQRLQNPAIRPDGTPAGFIQNNENAIFISFAKDNKFLLDLGWKYFKIPVEIPFGLNFKIIQIGLGEESASGLGFDFGSMVKFDMNDLFSTVALGKFGIGFVVKDVTQTSITWSTKHRDSIKPSFNWGILYEQKLHFFDSDLNFAFGRTDSGSGGKGIGIEWKLFHRFFLRGGSKDKNFTAGAGFLLSFFRIDYAFANHELGFSHRISADIDLNFLKSDN